MHETDEFINQIDHAVLTKEEEYNLLLHRDDPNNFAILVQHNLLLVKKVAVGFMGGSLTIDDLMQEGTIALMKAIRDYDLNSGNRLSTMAITYIRNHLLRVLNEKSDIIRKPTNLKMLAHTYRQKKENLLSTVNKPLSFQEIAMTLNIKYKDVLNYERVLIETKSLDNLSPDLFTNEEGNKELNLFNENCYDCIMDSGPTLEENYLDNDMVESVDDIFHKCNLSPMEKDVLKSIYGFKDHLFTLQELGDKYHMTIENIRLIKNKALNKLRIMKETRNLIDYANDERTASYNLKLAMRHEKANRHE